MGPEESLPKRQAAPEAGSFLSQRSEFNSAGLGGSGFYNWVHDKLNIINEPFGIYHLKAFTKWKFYEDSTTLIQYLSLYWAWNYVHQFVILEYRIKTRNISNKTSFLFDLDQSMEQDTSRHSVVNETTEPQPSPGANPEQRSNMERAESKKKKGTRRTFSDEQVKMTVNAVNLMLV